MLANSWYLDFGFWQALILLGSVVVTISVYFFQKRSKVTDAANILLLQIRDIEHNIEYINKECIDNEFIQEKPIHYSKNIFEENYWIKYNHLFVSKIDSTSFERIDKFFKSAEEIKIQQQYVKNYIFGSLNSRALYYYNAYYGFLNKQIEDKLKISSDSKEVQIIGQQNNKDNDKRETSTIPNSPLPSIQYQVDHARKAIDEYYSFSVKTYIPQEFGFGLRKELSGYESLTGQFAFQEIKKLAKRSRRVFF